MRQILGTLGWLAYPLLVYFGLHVMQPRYVALLFAVVLLVRHRQQARGFMASLTQLDRVILASLLGLNLLTAAINSELMLRLYPAAFTFGMLVLFTRSLYAAPSMIERFARLEHPDLSPQAIRYTFRVTQVWCIFLATNALIALYTAFFTGRDTWSLYNGLISYLLMGCLFAGEWLVRKYLAKLPEA